ncbi:PRC-barrel domain-containing protein [Hoeflea ulvae]|uniref:PRC-barrel domain-containing protein n=1 Tax=Hoeflea ulvae TaxID=2983764 RepID=A0ABT3YI23_9HYPH|nr:PRC-barrel domain-containing protein [Hoeflea ulvae]MCY0095267.1 PRC-barrel domain-containing protein [Hoeflea ulvae]
MIKTLLASTALTALVATSAFAASHTSATDTNAAATTTTETNAAATTDTNAAATTDTNAATTATSDTADMAHSNVTQHGATLASDLIGSAVYGSSAEDADMIGDVNDVVISPEGEVASVIIGVGGFLGIGEKDVEVEYGAIEWADRDGDRWLVANMTREQLEAAPAFDRTLIYDEARSEPEGVDTTQNMAADNTQPMATDNNQAAVPAAPADNTAADTTAERVENGESAVAEAEEKTMTIDRMSMTAVTVGDISADDLIGRTVYGANDENIGEIGDVLLSADNQIDGFVLDVGGFLGMGEKEVAVSPENLDIRADADGNLTVFTPFTQEQLEGQPEYNEDTWETDRDSVIMIAPTAG